MLGLRIKYHHKARKNVLVQADKSNQIHNALLLIDEASYANEELMNFVYKICRNCKIVKRSGVVRVICVEPKHKQRQG